MKRVLGISLLLLLVILSGCGGGSSSGPSSRITVTGTIYKDNSGTPLTAADFNGGTIKVTALTAGQLGLGTLADVNDANVSSSGTFTLRYVPTNRRIVLRIGYYQGKSLAFYAWYLFDPSKSNASITIRPRELAAHRLAFDLVRSYVDFKLVPTVFGDYYKNIEQSIEPTLGGDLANWMATPSSFTAYLQGKITPDTHIPDLKNIVSSGVYHYDKFGNGDHKIIDEEADDKADNYRRVLDSYLVSDFGKLNITKVTARVDTAAQQITVNVNTEHKNLNLALVLNDKDFTLANKKVIPFNTSSSVTFNYSQLPGYSNLPGVVWDKTFYLQVIAADAENYFSSPDYGTLIDYDRTPNVGLTIIP